MKTTQDWALRNLTLNVEGQVDESAKSPEQSGQKENDGSTCFYRGQGRVVLQEPGQPFGGHW